MLSTSIVRLALSCLLVSSAQAPAPDSSAAPLPAGRAVETIRPEHREELAVLDTDALNREEAQRLFAAGKQAGKVGRWAEAIPYFAEAYRYSGRPGALYALGRSHRQVYLNSGRDPVQLRLALLRFEQFLSRAPADPNHGAAVAYMDELRPYARVLAGFGDAPPVTRLMIYSPVAGAVVSVDGAASVPAPVTVDVRPGRHQVVVHADGYHEGTRAVPVPEGATVPLEFTLRAKMATLRVIGPRRAQLFIDGRSQGRLPAQAATTLAAGPHQVAVALPGRTPFIREVALARGQTRELSVTLPSTAQRKLSFTAIALGSIGLVTGAGLGGASLGAQRQAASIGVERRAMGIGIERYGQEQRAWARRDALRTAATITGSVGLAIIVTGVVLLVTDRPRLADRLYHPQHRATPPAPAAATAPRTGQGPQ